MDEDKEKVNILVVNDRPDQLLSITEVLASLGENVIAAESGKEALRHLMKNDFAVILLDVNMPEMNGFELAELIRKRGKSRHTPIIFLTASDPSANGHLRGYSLGAVDYIYAPFDQQVLLAKVRAFIDLHRQALKIKKQTEELQAINQKLMEEIRLRTRAEKSLRRAEIELKKANEELEKRVAERTAELLYANIELDRENKERREAEQRAAAAAARLEHLINSTMVMVYSCEPSGEFPANFFSANTKTQLGHDPQDFIGQPSFWVNNIHPEDREGVLTDRPRLLEEGHDIKEYRFRHKDGQWRWMRDEMAIVRDESGRPLELCGAWLDITDRIEAESKVARLASALEQIAESVSILDLNRRIYYVNPAFERMTGYCLDEVAGREPGFLITEAQTPAFYDSIWTTLDQGRVWSGGMTNQRKDGVLYQVKVTASPVKDANGRVIDYVFVGRDVTTEKALEAQLRQTQKMQAIGTLAGGIAHDFNNILNSIIGYTEVALLDLPPDCPTRDDLNQVLSAGTRAAELVKQILLISRRREQELGPMEVDPIVKEALKLLQAALPATIEIRQDLKPHLGPILGDPTQLHQIIMNLCTNAKHAMQEKGGVLEIGLEQIRFYQDELLLKPELKPGDYLRLSVSDTGHGIPLAIRDRIFEPYFTTKEAGEGTGLGLAVVNGIVKNLGGTITVYSEVNQGTVFHVYFPVYHWDKTPEAEAIVATTATRGEGRIMAIDDEENLIAVYEKALTRLGYGVESYTSSLEALEAFQAAPHHYDLVLTDQTMPKMIGLELARQIKLIRPDIPIILATGFVSEATEEQARLIGIEQVLPKPMKMAKLSETIKSVLERKNKNAGAG
ncbi:MAG: response regulator [Thermodesulfobacteriota bacterium]